MIREAPKNTITLFLNFQKLIVNPKRLFFSDIKALITGNTDEKGFDKIVNSISLADTHPGLLVGDIVSLTEKIKSYFNTDQKLIFITTLFKIAINNNQQDNQFVNKAIYGVADVFSYTAEQTDSIKKMFLSDLPTELDYNDSLLLTNVLPDYTEVIDGFKVIYDPSFSFKIWIKNVRSVNSMLFKIIEFDYVDKTIGIVAGDILTYNRSIQSLLESHNITFNKLATKIISNSDLMPRIEIPATDRSPRVILNASESRIEIEGISMTLQPHNFFAPVFYWLEKMKSAQPSSLSFHINLTFFNTYASKIILRMMQKAMELELIGCEIKFYWYYEEEDDEIKEAGEHYASIINKEINFIATTTNEIDECLVKFKMKVT